MKTVPTNKTNTNPELNMMVLINIYENDKKSYIQHFGEYYITSFDAYNIKLTNVYNNAGISHYHKYHEIEKSLTIPTRMKERKMIMMN